MHRKKLPPALLFVTLLVTSCVTIGGEFKPYPGARIDEKAALEPRKLAAQNTHPTQNGLIIQNNSFLQAVLPADGTYYIRVSDYWNDDGSSYTYRLPVRFSARTLPTMPQITSITPKSASQGSAVSLVIQGTNLSDASEIGLSPSDGITIGNLQSSATQVTALLNISSGATTGSRQVSVTTAQGTSNALVFTITATEGGAADYLHQSPASASPGASVNLSIQGSNLSGTTFINFSPSSAMTITNLQSTANQITASVTFASNASTGERSVTVTTPAGTSNSLSFTAIPVPAVALPLFPTCPWALHLWGVATRPSSQEASTSPI